MASILDAVLEFVKAPVSACTEATGENFEAAREAIDASTTNILVEARPSKDAPIGLVEESVPEKPKSPAPEAPPMVTWNTLFDMLQERSYHWNKLPK
jgi:hypothetical protein